MKIFIILFLLNILYKNFKPKIVVIDFGVKQNILRHLVNINAEITVLSEDTQIEDIKKLKPDGIFLSNGPETRPQLKKNVETYFNHYLVKITCFWNMYRSSIIWFIIWSKD